MKPDVKLSTSGAEITARWSPASWWRLEGGYSSFRFVSHLSADSHDAEAASFDGNAPSGQWHARSAVSVTSRVQLDAMLFHTGALEKIGIDAYTRTDARAEVSVTHRLTLSIVGQNLFDAEHAEYGGTGAIVTATQIPRSAHLQLRWQF